MWANVNECGVNGFDWLMSLQHCYYTDAVHLLVVVYSTKHFLAERREDRFSLQTWHKLEQREVCDECKHLFEKNTSGRHDVNVFYGVNT